MTLPRDTIENESRLGVLKYLFRVPAVKDIDFERLLFPMYDLFPINLSRCCTCAFAAILIEEVAVSSETTANFFHAARSFDFFVETPIFYYYCLHHYCTVRWIRLVT